MQTKNILDKIDKVLIDNLRIELRRQGHDHTGRLNNSIRGNIKGTSLIGYMLDYGFIQDEGVRPNRIPYQQGSGKKTSKYIDALTAYFQLRGLSAKEAKSAAFATARKHKKEGMSTFASRRFSSTKKREEFVKDTMKVQSKVIDRIAEDGMKDIFEKEFKKQKSEII